MKKVSSFFVLGAVIILCTSVTSAEQTPVSLVTASGEQLSAAMGHYGRARSLLIAAVREFDLAYKKVDPAVIIEADEWRQSIMDRAEDLERILDPQPRASKGGVRFNADTRLLHEAKK